MWSSKSKGGVYSPFLSTRKNSETTCSERAWRRGWLTNSNSENKSIGLLLSSFLTAHLWCLEPLPTQLPWSYQAGESTLGGHREMKKYSRSPKLKLPAQMPDTWVSGLCTLSSIMTTTTAQTDPKKVLRCLIYKLLCFAQINCTRGKKPQERTTELGNTNSPKTVRSHTKIIVVLACFGISSYAIYIQNRL